MYTPAEFEFIDRLLKLSLKNDLTFSDMGTKHKLDYNLYDKLFTHINKDPYRLIECYNENLVITPLGRQVERIGFEKYLNEQKEKTNLDARIKAVTLRNIKWTSIRGWIAIEISLLALLIASMTYINKKASNKSDENTLPSKAADSRPIKEISKDSAIVDTSASVIIHDSISK